MGNFLRGLTMSDKFKNVPVDDDTRILSQEIKRLDKFEALYQLWSWDGYKGESIIFSDDDVKNLSEAEIKEIIRKSSLLKDKESKMTFSQSGSGYTFINFNFE